MIVSAAILQDGKYYTGRRHPFIIRHLVEDLKYQKPIMGEQGFMTDKGIFLNRYDAAKHAIECGQIIKPKWGNMLFSEDVW